MKQPMYVLISNRAKNIDDDQLTIVGAVSDASIGCLATAVKKLREAHNMPDYQLTTVIHLDDDQVTSDTFDELLSAFDNRALIEHGKSLALAITNDGDVYLIVEVPGIV